MPDGISGDCLTSHYLISERLIDVRMDHNPLPASATWCSRHDQWISSCSYQWQEKAKVFERQSEALQKLVRAADFLTRKATTREEKGAGLLAVLDALDTLDCAAKNSLCAMHGISNKPPCVICEGRGYFVDGANTIPCGECTGKTKYEPKNDCDTCGDRHPPDEPCESIKRSGVSHPTPDPRCTHGPEARCSYCW